MTTAFRDVDRRSFVRKKLVAIVLTLCTFAFGAVSIGVIAFVPSVLASLGAPGPIRWLVGVLRWPLLAGGMLSALAVLYRIARPETRPRPRLVTVGAVVAAVVWIAGSLLFSLYAANFGRYQATYGSLASIVVLLLWLLLSAFVIILGAEIDAAAAGTTRGD